MSTSSQVWQFVILHGGDHIDQHWTCFNVDLCGPIMSILLQIITIYINLLYLIDSWMNLSQDRVLCAKLHIVTGKITNSNNFCSLYVFCSRDKLIHILTNFRTHGFIKLLDEQKLCYMIKTSTKHSEKWGISI